MLYTFTCLDQKPTVLISNLQHTVHHLPIQTARQQSSVVAVEYQTRDCLLVIRDSSQQPPSLQYIPGLYNVASWESNHIQRISVYSNSFYCSLNSDQLKCMLNRLETSEQIQLVNHDPLSLHMIACGGPTAWQCGHMILKKNEQWGTERYCRMPAFFHWSPNCTRQE